MRVGVGECRLVQERAGGCGRVQDFQLLVVVSFQLQFQLHRWQ